MTFRDVVTKFSWRSYLKQKFFLFAYRSGLVRVGRELWANNLTVLNYHRIGNTAHREFDTFKPNVSAHPEEFALQMDYLSRWFNVVSLREIVQWLDGKRSLPPYAALITFDDGYFDNYKYAYPLLQKRNFPAAIFLTTGHIQQDVPFYWDLIAYCFHHTTQNVIFFPDGQERHWESKLETDIICQELIEKLKLLPEIDKLTWVEHIPKMLKVSIPAGYFKNLMMTWDQVREMQSQGIEFGGHTMNHPILTRVSYLKAKEEIISSKAIIEHELNQSILGFAYPNGGRADFNKEIELLTAEAGYRVAFTLLNGPTKLREVKQNPFTIRRIFISENHTLPIFSALVSGFNRYRNS